MLLILMPTILRAMKVARVLKLCVESDLARSPGPCFTVETPAVGFVCNALRQRTEQPFSGIDLRFASARKNVPSNYFQINKHKEQSCEKFLLLSSSNKSVELLNCSTVTFRSNIALNATGRTIFNVSQSTLTAGLNSHPRTNMDLIVIAKLFCLFILFWFVPVTLAKVVRGHGAPAANFALVAAAATTFFYLQWGSLLN
jgi:hypothetical protein